MRAFRFRLEKVLELRRQIEEDKKRQLSLLLFELRQLEARLSRLRSELEQQKKKLSHDLEESQVCIPRIEVFAAYLKRVMETIESVKDQMVQLHKKIERRRGELIEATKERKALESVRAKRLAEYLREEARGQVRFLDEVAGRIALGSSEMDGLGG